MQKVYEPRYYMIKSIKISHIIFDSTEWVTLWGKVLHQRKEYEINFITDFDKLNKILRLSGMEGDKIQMMLVELLEGKPENPYFLDLEEKMSKLVFFDKCRLKVYHPQDKDKLGNWQEDKNCLFIDDVVPQIMSRAIMPKTTELCRDNFNRCKKILKNLYELYLGYRELNFEEAAALKKAELEDEFKFKMAYYAWAEEVA